MLDMCPNPNTYQTRVGAGNARASVLEFRATSTCQCLCELGQELGLFSVSDPQHSLEEPPRRQSEPKGS